MSQIIPESISEYAKFILVASLDKLPHRSFIKIRRTCLVSQANFAYSAIYDKTCPC